MSFVELQNISWKYDSDDPEVLSNISLDIDQREFIGIMGPTGAGKSTLSLVIRGLIPDFFEDGTLSGKAVVSGIEVTASSPNLIVNYVGNVFQDASSQILGTTVFDDIAFGPSNLGLPKEEVLGRVNTYIDKLNLRQKIYRKPDSLSGGETQRLVSAGVLCMEPQVLVMDEPAAELDPRGRTDLCEILDDLRQDKDITVVLIEQDPELIAQYSSRVALMNEGKIVAYGPSREVFKNAALCEEIGVAPPEMVRLAHELKRISGIIFSQLPLTTNEMYSCLLEKMNIKHDILVEVKSNEPYYDYLPFEKNETPLYQFDNVVHTFDTPGGRFNALDGVSLNIYKGDYITLIGTNGAGKSTFTKHINNILTPTSGRVHLRSIDIKGRDTSDFLSEVGYCFQNPDHQIFSSTVKEEVAYGLVNLGLEQDEIDKKVNEILELLDLSDLKDENPFNLGKGERQKIAIASTVVMEPEFLVIDEPTTGLDWFESKKILELIEKLHKRGMTILAVTHDMRIVREYSSRVVAMHQGNIVYDGDVSGLLDYQKLFETANISLPPILELYHMLKLRFPMITGEKIRTIEDMASLIKKLLGSQQTEIKG
ncbi:energy-coupling factor transporter ATPase [Neobacillus niacini]|uniref:ABC transporter ATP-binding protein n=1 Tax=Neobacillus niacini TaxID=86668 RepID=UPI002FFF52D0